MKIINTTKAPQAVGPYSQAIIHNDLLFISGQIAIDPKTNTVINDNIEAQTELICNNIKNILEEANTSYSNVLKTTVFVKDIKDFNTINEIYAKYFISKPARSLVEVSNLPKGVSIEIEVIAKVD